MKKCIAFIFLILLLSSPLFASDYSLTNNFVGVFVSDEGRIYIKTTGGNPLTPLDNDKEIVSSDFPIFTTVKVDDDAYIYGSSDGDFEEDIDIREKEKAISGWWSVKDVWVKQEVKIVNGLYSRRPDTVRITFVISNADDEMHHIGLRMFIDFSIGDKDGLPIYIPERGIISNEDLLYGDKIPNFWYSFDPENPLFGIQGTLMGLGLVKPDKVIFGAREKLYNSIWAYVPETGSPFWVRFGAKKDVAELLFFPVVGLPKGGVKEYSTSIGLWGASSTNNGSFFLFAICPSVPSENPFVFSADVVYLGKDQIPNASLRLNLHRGFFFPSGYSNAKNLGTLSSGSVRSVSWKVGFGRLGGTFPLSVQLLSGKEVLGTVERKVSIYGVKSVQTTAVSSTPSEERTTTPASSQETPFVVEPQPTKRKFKYKYSNIDLKYIDLYLKQINREIKRFDMKSVSGLNEKDVEELKVKEHYFSNKVEQEEKKFEEKMKKEGVR